MESNDRFYLEKIKEGNHDAYKHLYHKYRDEFHILVTGRVSDQARASDLLQNLWIKIWENPDFVKTDENGQMGLFIYSYLHFRILDAHRELKKQAEIHAGAEADIHEISDEEYFDLWDSYEVQDALNFIEECLAELPDTVKKIHSLRFKKHFTVPEVALKMNLSEKTVRNYLSNLTKHLRTEAKTHKIHDKILILTAVIEALNEMG